LVAAKARAEEDQEAAKAQLQEARALLEKSQSKGEDSATIHSELADIYFRLGMWDKAAESYEQALRMRRTRNDWRRQLAHAYAQLGRVGEAEKKFREALAFSPDDAEAWKGLQSMGKRY
jgi:Tfp pilus assembly protein PilF